MQAHTNQPTDKHSVSHVPLVLLNLPLVNAHAPHVHPARIKTALVLLLVCLVQPDNHKHKLVKLCVMHVLLAHSHQAVDNPLALLVCLVNSPQQPVHPPVWAVLWVSIKINPDALAVNNVPLDSSTQWEVKLHVAHVLLDSSAMSLDNRTALHAHQAHLNPPTACHHVWHVQLAHMSTEKVNHPACLVLSVPCSHSLDNLRVCPAPLAVLNPYPA